MKYTYLIILFLLLVLIGCNKKVASTPEIVHQNEVDIEKEFFYLAGKWYEGGLKEYMGTDLTDEIYISDYNLDLSFSGYNRLKVTSSDSASITKFFFVKDNIFCPTSLTYDQNSNDIKFDYLYVINESTIVYGVKTIGFNTGKYTHQMFFKEGYSPTVEFVKKYQGEIFESYIDPEYENPNLK